MSTILYEWEFANYLCRVVESEPGIVHFEQARKESGGDPRVMEFRRTATPMGAANEIIQLHQALAEAEMLNRDLAAFYQGYQEDRNRREQRIAQLEADLEAAREAIKKLSWERCPDCDGGGILGTCRDGRKQSCSSCGGSEDSRGDGWLPNHDNISETMESPAVRAAWEGR